MTRRLLTLLAVLASRLRLYNYGQLMMVNKETLQCAHGDKCKQESPTINTKDTGTWSIDLEKSRNDIVTALHQLRRDKKLPLVSGWRVS